MCLICSDLAKGALTSVEAFKNLEELYLNKKPGDLSTEELEHLEVVLGRIDLLSYLERIKV